MSKYREPTVDDVGKNVQLLPYIQLDKGHIYHCPISGRQCEFTSGKLLAVIQGDYPFVGLIDGEEMPGMFEKARIAVEEKFESKLTIPRWVGSSNHELANHLSMAIGNILELEERIWELERKDDQ